MKDACILGVDLGKNSCSLVGLDAAGRGLLRRRTRREGVLALAAKLPGCVVAMEACCGAHHLGRALVAQSHEVRLMSPEYVRPYVKAQKNDDRDAEAIAEAATRPTMRFVALKSEAQLDVQTLHRVRDRLVGQRTSLTNQIRSILLERGIVVPQGRRGLLDALAALPPWRRCCRATSAGSVRAFGCCSTTCSINGVPSTRASRGWTMSSRRWRATIPPPAVSPPSPASG